MNLHPGNNTHNNNNNWSSSEQSCALLNSMKIARALKLRELWEAGWGG